MDPDHARELLRIERERIERSLGRTAHTDDGEPADEFDPGSDPNPFGVTPQSFKS